MLRRMFAFLLGFIWSFFLLFRSLDSLDDGRTGRVPPLPFFCFLFLFLPIALTHASAAHTNDGDDIISPSTTASTHEKAAKRTNARSEPSLISRVGGRARAARSPRTWPPAAATAAAGRPRGAGAGGRKGGLPTSPMTEEPLAARPRQRVALVPNRVLAAAILEWGERALRVQQAEAAAAPAGAAAPPRPRDEAESWARGAGSGGSGGRGSFFSSRRARGGGPCARTAVTRSSLRSLGRNKLSRARARPPGIPNHHAHPSFCTSRL